LAGREPGRSTCTTPARAWLPAAGADCGIGSVIGLALSPDGLDSEKAPSGYSTLLLAIRVGKRLRRSARGARADASRRRARPPQLRRQARQCARHL